MVSYFVSLLTLVRHLSYVSNSQLFQDDHVLTCLLFILIAQQIDRESHAQQLNQSSNLVQQQRPAPYSWVKHQTQPQKLPKLTGGSVIPSYQQQPQQQRLTRAKSSLVTSNAISNNGHRIIRHLPGESFDLDGFAKPSLGDKIRYLLIGANDKPQAGYAPAMIGRQTVRDNVEFYRQQNDNNVIYQAYTQGNNETLALTSASSSSSKTAWSNISQACNADTNLQQQKADDTLTEGSSGDAQSSPKKSLTPPQVPPKSTTSCIAHEGSPARSDPSANDTFTNMGNRQQRQYQVQKQAEAQAITYHMRRQSDGTANSHLIVDLTTPRVLAKTQTTLTASSNQESPSSIPASRDAWSINQLGLPQMSGSEKTLPVDTNRPVKELPEVDSRNKDEKEKSSLGDINKKHSNDNCERTAPYYYSDLKSEEQRLALLNIVHQKSLSPPPQLLSRSTDQSSTRLTARSATMRSSQAKNLSESAEVRQRQSNGRDLTVVKQNDFSSTSNIAENIDKLFDSPMGTTVQSMLDLNNCRAVGNESEKKSPSQANDLSSTTCGLSSNELKSKNFSKSKSLENISKEANSLGEIASRSLINPVYENIRRSNKLMDAINDSTTCFSVNKINSGHVASVSSSSKANSDESMDSILGSSLEDFDSGSDITDEIKISTTDNHLTDISQLIEQLKNNHSKLTGEYKSTLARIAKTINVKNKQVENGEQGDNEKLSLRLQMLELKSKKYESRSRNQLALIQMMEKVLKQSQSRSSSTNNNSAGKKLLYDDEDFIEFLSSDSSSHRTQFEASQFSASDFNTSTTSESATSTSGAKSDSLNSLLTISKVNTTTGDVKTEQDEDRQGKMNSSNSSSNNNNNDEGNNHLCISTTKETVGILKKGKGCRGDAKNDLIKVDSGARRDLQIEREDAKRGSDKFNNVLGNVIDVDVCPLNNLSRCSPVGSGQASLLN